MEPPFIALFLWEYVFQVTNKKLKNKVLEHNPIIISELPILSTEFVV